MRRRILTVLLVGGLTGLAQAALVDRGDGMIYDDVLNVTWLQNANPAGSMNWDDSEAWANNLDFGGFDDWRLPSMDRNVDEVIVDCRTASDADCQDNELGYMYYHNLQGTSGENLTGNQGLFENIQFVQWSGTSSFLPGPVIAWDFAFGNGDQGFGGKFDESGAWAVRDGDVASTGQDTDADGVSDTADNCIDLANGDQRDLDGDGIGNACDPDVAEPNDCLVNFLDLAVYQTNFFQAGDYVTDNNGDGQTNFLDLNIARNFFFGPPGPSAGGCN